MNRGEESPISWFSFFLFKNVLHCKTEPSLTLDIKEEMILLFLTADPAALLLFFSSILHSQLYL